MSRRVRGLLRLVEGGRYTCAEVKAITLDHLADVHRKIADLQRLERTLTEVADKCSDGKCPIAPSSKRCSSHETSALPGVGDRRSGTPPEPPVLHRVACAMLIAS